MISAEIAWELAQNTKGKFRLGLGSQVKAHITRRYASPFDKPAPADEGLRAGREGLPVGLPPRGPAAA